jgi:hypothetical protein
MEGSRRGGAGGQRGRLILKEQILILKVRYEEGERSPHTWDWSSLIGSDHEVEVMNHGVSETIED